MTTKRRSSTAIITKNNQFNVTVSSLAITNNIFIGGTDKAGSRFISGRLTDATVTNNIFYGTTPGSNGSPFDRNSFLNNISRNEKLNDDTIKVERFLWLASETSGIDTVVSGFYGRRAYALAIKLNDLKGIGNSYNYFGRRYYQTQKYNDAIKCFEKAADYFSKSKYLRGSASALGNVGVIFNEQGNFDKAIEFLIGDKLS